MRSDTEIGREESGAAGLDREISESERTGSARDGAGNIGRTGRRGRDGERGRDAALKTDRNIQADAPAVSAGQAGDGSSQPVDATGAARVMLERAFPQAGQTSAQGQMADGQGVAQNAAAPVVDGQPVYSDIALADYMAKQAAQQKFGDATRSGAEIQHTGMIEAEVQPELANTTIVTPEENVVASAQNDGTIIEKNQGASREKYIDDLNTHLNSWNEFNNYAQQIGTDTTLTDSEKIVEIHKVFESSSYKVDINIPRSVQYIKGFDSAGNVIYDWPPKLGFDDKTITSISRNNRLPSTWDRYGYMGGSNFSDVPAGGKYTYSQRALPYVENEMAYHTGTFNIATYYDKIDAIKTGDIIALNHILRKEGIRDVDTTYFENLRDTYNDFIADVADVIGPTIDATYGLKGKAAAWGEMEGGAMQFVTPISGNMMFRLGIIN